MSDVNGAPSGGETTVITPADDAPAEFSSVAEAAAALTAARQPKKPPAEAVEEPELEAQAANSDPETDPAEEPNEAEPEEIPPIEPPRSWTKAEKERFQSLPRETQEYLHTREQERERDFRRSQNEAAEERKAIAAEREAAKQARQQYEAQLPALMQSLQDAQQNAFSDIRTVDDVTKLANEDPFRYLQWQAHQTKLQAVNAENERAKGERSKAEQAEWAKHVQKENGLAIEYIPELADKVKGPALTQRAAERLTELGFKQEELAKLASGQEKLSLYDHRLQRLIFNDLKYSEIKAAPAKVLPKAVPPVTRPGVSKPAGSAQSEALQALENNFNRTGSLKDAEALRNAQLRQRLRA